MRNFISIVVFAFSVLFLSPADAQNGKSTMVLEISGFASNDGMARILIFQSANKKGFPKDVSKAFRSKIVPIKNNSVVVEFADLPNGDYAASVHHDENNDGKVNTNFIGIPTEGFGATNDARSHFGPPNFDQAKVSLFNQKSTFRIKIVN